MDLFDDDLTNWQKAPYVPTREQIEKEAAIYGHPSTVPGMVSVLHEIDLQILTDTYLSGLSPGFNRYLLVQFISRFKPIFTCPVYLQVLTDTYLATLSPGFNRYSHVRFISRF